MQPNYEGGPMAQTPTEVLSVRVPSATAAAFRRYVQRQGRSVNAVLSEAVAEHLADEATR
jgi:hypothetical protein